MVRLYYLLRFTDIPPRLAWRHVTNTVAMEDKLVPTNSGSQAARVELNEQWHAFQPSALLRQG